MEVDTFSQCTKKTLTMMSALTPWFIYLFIFFLSLSTNCETQYITLVKFFLKKLNINV